MNQKFNVYQNFNLNQLFNLDQKLNLHQKFNLYQKYNLYQNYNLYQTYNLHQLKMLHKSTIWGFKNLFLPTVPHFCKRKEKICYLNEFRKWLMMVGEIANSIVNMASRCRSIIRSRWRRIIDNIMTRHTSPSLQILRCFSGGFSHWIFGNIGHWTRMVLMVSSLFLLVINQVIVLSVEE